MCKESKPREVTETTVLACSGLAYNAAYSVNMSLCRVCNPLSVCCALI